MNERNFFAELKRRNVYKVAVAYAVASWLIAQAASLLFGVFEAPPWAMKIFIVTAALGFPIALVLSWAFEITPEGIKLESEIAPNEQIARRAGRKIVGLTIALAIVAASLLAFQLLRSKSLPNKPSLTEAQKLTQQARTSSSSPAIPDNKSIAVLAFTNLSDDKSNEYFSDGISEELLNVLSKVPGLEVSARTSAFHFKGKDTPIPEIAQQLGVAYVVEGSVRRSGDRVRITAQLIKAADGFHVWSENFDRELKDIFAVQDEIAGLIAKNLQLKLDAGSVAGVGATKNMAAYEAFLKGRQAWNSDTASGYCEAVQQFLQAIELDPDFALAHGALAEAYVSVANNGLEPAKKCSRWRALRPSVPSRSIAASCKRTPLSLNTLSITIGITSNPTVTSSRRWRSTQTILLPTTGSPRTWERATG